MTKYQTSVFGSWVKGGDLQSGIQCELVSEAKPAISQFKDKDGNDKMQDVAKIKFSGVEEIKNINLNRSTIDGLISAFGEDSKDWIGKPLIAVTEKVVVAGRRVTAVYLLADGYELKEDDGGYMKIVNPNKELMQ